MRFGVLGPLAVWSPDGEPVTITGRKVRALLADLLLADGQPVSADRLIDDLWTQGLPADPAGALHVKVSQLRRALDAAEPGGRDLLVSGTWGYRLDVPSEAVDVGRFADLVARARAGQDPWERVPLLTEALALWRGPTLGEVADLPFAQRAVVRLDEQRLVALEELADARLELGEHDRLVADLNELVAQHPLRERLRAAQLRALYGAGRHHEALAAYEEHRRHLRDEFGLDPGTELQQLHQAILRQDPGLAPQPARPVSPARPATNLPAATSTAPDGGLIGRTAVIADVRASLAAQRLVTLTGPGGVGKTRLALEVARAAVEDRADGGWIVELGDVDPGTTPLADGIDAIASTVAATLGIHEDAASGLPAGAGHRGVADRLASALRSRQAFLVLDDCEHVIEPVAHLVERLLRVAPHLSILVTSQVPVGSSGEVVFPVPPLEVPRPGATADELSRTAAVQLFVTRAAAAQPGFAVRDDDVEAVGDICRRLDGIPLALELAASRVRTLQPRALAARLDDRFALLAAGHRTAPRRQRTLRAVIDWSWELASPAERVVLRRLAVHAGGCTLEAAEAVCAGGEVAARDVVEVLRRLVDRSLITVADDGPVRRYRLLGSVAAYALERLDEADETAAVRRRHAVHHAELAARTAPLLRGRDQRDALRRLDREAANLRAALETAVHQGAADVALRLANAAAWYWFLRGRHQEARRSLTLALGVPAPEGSVDAARAEAATWLAAVASTDHVDDPVARRDAALERHAALDDPAGLAHARWLFAFSMLGSGDTATGEQLVATALAGFREVGDRWGTAAALFTRAEHALVEGDLAAVRRDSEASLQLFDELGDGWGRLYPTHLLGVLAEIDGDYGLAARLHRDALRIAEDLALWPSVSMQLASLGRVCLLEGDLAQAAAYHGRARQLAEEQSDGAAAAFATTGLALGARRQGELDVAEELLRELLEWNRRTDYDPGSALVLAELGFVAEHRGDAEAARTWHTAGLAAARATGDVRAVALALEGLAGASTLVDEHDLAARMLGAAAAARRDAQAPLPPAERGDVDRIVRRARGALGPEAFDAEFALGRAMGLDELPVPGHRPPVLRTAPER